MPPGEADPATAEVKIERALEASTELVAGLGQLLPLLSPARPPDREALARVLADPSTYLFVARNADGTPVGTLTLAVLHLVTGTRALIEDVVVDTRARGAGLGARLVTEALAAAATAGARTVELTSRPSREAANRLYERCGFERRETNVWRVTLRS